MKYFDEIVSTLSDSEKRWMNITESAADADDDCREEFILFVDDKPVSGAEISWDNTGAAIAVATDPSYRKQGLGTLVVEQALHFIKENDCNRVVWWTQKTNEASINLAVKCGFLPIAESVTSDDPWILYRKLF